MATSVVSQNISFIDLISALVKVYENGSTDRPQLKLPLPDAFNVGKKE